MGTWNPGPDSTNGNDVFTGNATGELADGLADGLDGADILNGNGGNDTLYGGDDDVVRDRLLGGNGDDVLIGLTADLFNGGAGLDEAIVHASGNGAVFSLDLRGVDANGNGVSADGSTTFAAVEKITVNPFFFNGRMVIHGHAGVDELNGGSLNDSLYGNGGADTLYGYDGVDFLSGGAGDDRLESARYDMSDVHRGDILDGGPGNDSLSGSLGDDFRGGLGDEDAVGLRPVSLQDTTFYVDLRALDSSGNGTLADGTSFSGAEEIAVIPGSSVDQTIRITAYGHNGANRFIGAASSDVFYGMGGDDQLWGFGGADTLDGGTGNDFLYSQRELFDTDVDIMRGGWGNDELWGGVGDQFIGGGGDDRAYYTAAQGQKIIDFRSISAAGDGTLADGTRFEGIETIFYNGNGGVSAKAYGHDGADNLQGSEATDYLYGGAGDDGVYGGGGAGANYMDGGAGDDFFNGQFCAFDTAVYGSALSGVTVRLDMDGVEQDTISAGMDMLYEIENITGSGYDDHLYGNSFANVLDGGAGADVLEGADGDDTYGVNSLSDVIVEAAAEGVDTVRASINWVLGSELENLVLLGGALNGTGNSVANIITGNAAANVLDGRAGADQLIGGAGDDTYIVDAKGDSIVEATGGGSDVVQASVNYTLSANVEHLTLTGAALWRFRLGQTQRWFRRRYVRVFDGAQQRRRYDRRFRLFVGYDPIAPQRVYSA